MLALLKLEGLGEEEEEVKDNDELNEEEKKLQDEVKNIRQKVEKRKKELNSNNLRKEINYFQSILGQRDEINQDPKYGSPNIRQTSLLRGHFGKVQAVAWASDSNELVSASQDGKILIWNVNSGNKRLAISLTSAWTMCCDWSNDSNLIASGGLDNVCSIYDVQDDAVGWVSKRPAVELVQHQGYVSCAKFLDKHRLLTCSGDSSIIYWDIEGKKPITQWKNHSADVSSIDMSTDRNTFVSVSCDSTCKIWDLRDETGPIYSYEGLQNDLNDVRWFPDYNAFAVACDDSEVIFYDWLSRQKLVSYEKPQVKCNAIGVDFSKSGCYLFATYDGEPWCAVWNTLTAKPEQRLEHFTRPSAMQVSPDGTRLATGSWDNKIRLWA